MALSVISSLVIFLPTAICVLLQFPQNVASDSTEEANALLKWAASLQNLQKSNISSWPLHPHNASNSNQSITPCNWFGISCNQAGNVKGLNLTNARLKEVTNPTEATESSDVYSFGVVALEVVKGSHPGDIISAMSSSPRSTQLEDVPDPMLQVPTPEIELELVTMGEITRASMASDIISTMCSSSARKVSLEDILDPRLPTPTTEIEEELNTVRKIAIACLADNPHSRPTMNLITQILSSQATLP